MARSCRTPISNPGTQGPARTIRWIVAGLLGLLLLATRILAMPKSLFEWDDYIFGLALHLYAPQADVPQAPFFPLFVYAARLVRLFVREDVTALSAVSVVASAAALPLLWRTVGELFGTASRGLAARAVAVYAFLPAVWFYAGTPITDTAGATACLLVFWLAVRAMNRSGARELLLAFAVFGAACGVRPQSLVPALVPLAIAWGRSGARSRLAALGAAAAAGALFAVLPVGIAAGGVRPLLAPLRQRIEYTGSSTSVFSGVDWWYVARRWLRDPWVSKWLAIAAAVMMAVGARVLDRADRFDRRPTRLLLASFFPYGLLCVVFLDPTFGSRYLLPLMAPAAILIAGAALELERAWRLRAPLVTAAFVASCVVLVAPAILVVHGRPAPMAEAAARLRERVGGAPFALLYSEEAFAPAELLFPNVPKFPAEKTSPDALRAATLSPVWRFGVGSITDASEAACWPALPALERLTPGRYLTVPFGPWSRETPELAHGWSGEERNDRRPSGSCAPETIRWIVPGEPAVARFPPMPRGRTLVVEVSPDGQPRPDARLRVTWNGAALATAPLDRDRIAVRAAIPEPVPLGSGRDQLILLVEPDAAGQLRRVAVLRLAAVPLSEAVGSVQ